MKTQYIELIHKDIDGTITLSEKETLEDALKKDPDLQQLQIELKQTTDILGNVPQLDPPPQLKERILNSIHFNRPVAKSPASDWFTRLWGGLSAPRLRPAYVMITGIVVGIVFTTLFFITLPSDTQLPLNEIYGTIGLNENNYKTLDDVLVDVTGIQGHITLNVYQDMVWIDVTLEHQQPTYLHLNYREDLLSFNSIRPVDWGMLQVERENNRLILSCDQAGHYQVIYKKTSSDILPMSLQILQSGEKIFDHQFSLKH